LKVEIVRRESAVERDLRGLRYEIGFFEENQKIISAADRCLDTAAAVVGTLLVLLPPERRKFISTQERARAEEANARSGLFFWVR